MNLLISPLTDIEISLQLILITSVVEVLQRVSFIDRRLNLLAYIIGNVSAVIGLAEKYAD
jgi:hypothetical protein